MPIMTSPADLRARVARIGRRQLRRPGRRRARHDTRHQRHHRAERLPARPPHDVLLQGYAALGVAPHVEACRRLDSSKSASNRLTS